MKPEPEPKPPTVSVTETRYGTIVTVEYTGVMTFRPRAKPPAPPADDRKPADGDKPPQ